jgi:Tfp pilus assembly protein PilF
MVEALRERRAGNLARARELSSEYRLKYPAGALQEEALALSIEAAAALGDDEARRLSASYLQRYPQGRFRAQAQRVLGTPR